MAVKDQRIKMTNEILNGIRVLKLYAWETAFIRSITHIREQELKYIRQQAIIMVVLNVLSTFTPILVSRKKKRTSICSYDDTTFIKVGVTTFGTYVLSSKDNILTVEKAFVSLALFNMLQNPLFGLPYIINSLLEVSCGISFNAYGIHLFG